MPEKKALIFDLSVAVSHGSIIFILDKQYVMLLIICPISEVNENGCLTSLGNAYFSFCLCVFVLLHL